MAKLPRNPPWQRDELILALDLYFRHHPSHISKTHPEIKRTSEILNRLPVHGTRPDAARFRNVNGVYMKLCNFLRYDPSYKGSGLTRGNAEEATVWNELAGDPQRLHRIAQAIISGLAEPEIASVMPDEDEDYFPEGRVLYRVHRIRERNRQLVEKAKRAAERSGGIVCVVCGFDFLREYGDIGQGFIEVHHTIPVSEYGDGQRTKVADLALVCANCHRMLHRRRPWADNCGAIEASRKKMSH